MNLNSFSKFSFIGLAGLALVACGGKPKVTSCAGYELYDSPVSQIIDQEQEIVTVTFFGDDFSYEIDGREISIDGSNLKVQRDLVPLNNFPNELPYAILRLIP